MYVQEVLRGYIGDRSSKAIFDTQSRMGQLFSVLGSGYQRPFELATVRLQNMIGSLSNCASWLSLCMDMSNVCSSFTMIGMHRAVTQPVDTARACL